MPDWAKRWDRSRPSTIASSTSANGFKYRSTRSVWMAALFALNACSSNESGSRGAANHPVSDAASSAERDRAADAAMRSSEHDVDAGSSTRVDRACEPPANLRDAGPHVRACTFGRAYLECTFPGGGGCLCISDDPSMCRGCAAPCQNRCADDEYAVSCGGPPLLSEDGGVTETYQELLAGCVIVAGTPAGNAYACCPCE